MPPRYVKAYVKRGKTNAGNAAAICEAVSRPCMSFAPVKGVEQQGLSMPHSARSQLFGQRTQPRRGNALSACMSLASKIADQQGNMASAATRPGKQSVQWAPLRVQTVTAAPFVCRTISQ
jgi:hypothetical protein